MTSLSCCWVSGRLGCLRIVAFLSAFVLMWTFVDLFCWRRGRWCMHCVTNYVTVLLLVIVHRIVKAMYMLMIIATNTHTQFFCEMSPLFEYRASSHSHFVVRLCSHVSVCWKRKTLLITTSSVYEAYVDVVWICLCALDCLCYFASVVLDGCVIAAVGNRWQQCCLYIEVWLQLVQHWVFCV